MTGSMPVDPIKKRPRGPLSLVEETEMRMIQEALQANGGLLRPAAKALRMPKTTLFNRIRKYGLKSLQEVK